MKKRSLIGRVYYLSVLWLVCIPLHSLITRTTDAQLTDEVDVLLAFKKAVTITDPGYELKTWLSSSSPCTWSHVTCTDDLKNVRFIDLGRAGLRGHLVPGFEKLKYLERLMLFQNRLSGPIPLEFARIRSLKTLDLSSNYLSGHIPRHLPELRNLLTFDLSNNNLDDCAPDSALRDLQNRVRHFNISNNPKLCSTLLTTSPPICKAYCKWP